MGELTRDEYVGSIKSAIKEAGKTLVLQILKSRLPFLANPVLSPVVSYFVGQVLMILVDATEFGAFIIYTDIRTSKQGKDFVLAANRNRIAQESGTPEEKESAKKELMDSFRKFAVLTN